MFLLTACLPLLSANTRAADPPAGWEYTGRTEAVATVAVRPRVSGELTRVAVKEGAAVKKGDLLAEIDPRAYRLDLDAAKARRKVADAKLQAAKLRATNANRLVKGKVISQDELALNKAAEAEAEAALMAAKVEVQRAELTLSWTRVTAPIDGRVSRIPTTEGNLVVADQTHILTVVATDRLHVSFRVPEGALLRLRRDGLAGPGKLGVAVGFAGEEGYPHAAKLDLVEPEVDPNTGTVRFRATLANPKGILSPGMSARVRLSPPAK
jgi:RND family efflux transporter MFP subunit